MTQQKCQNAQRDDYGVNYNIYPGAQTWFPVQAILHNMMHGICNIKMSGLNVSLILKKTIVIG
jgi:hypothetical protein